MSITGQSQVNDAFERFLEERIAKLRAMIIRSFTYVGVECINKARLSGNYHDVTGNLRSSIGFVILEDGKVISRGGFDPVKDGNDGSAIGKDFIEEVISKYPTGIVLIVVAGMNYAAYVSAKGYDVLESSELLAKKLVPQMLSKLGFK